MALSGLILLVDGSIVAYILFHCECANIYCAKSFRCRLVSHSFFGLAAFLLLIWSSDLAVRFPT